MHHCRETTTLRRPGLLALAAQGLLVLAIGFVGFLPLDRGPMLLVPLTHRGAESLNELVDGSGAVVLGIGAMPGSRIIAGDRGRVLPRMLANGILVLPGVPSFCGSISSRGAR